MFAQPYYESKANGKTETMDLSPDFNLMEPELGANKSILGNSSDDGVSLVWIAWKF
jgi:hypothetical protein